MQDKTFLRTHSWLKTTALATAVSLTATVVGFAKSGQAVPKSQVIPKNETNVSLAGPAEVSGPKPNIIYILLDDMGFSDLGAYGSEIKTPNIDQLAANGLRYNNFNVNPLSSPTRASLLTARNMHAVGMGSVANVTLDDRPDLQGRVSHAAGTVAEVLKEQGYSTMGLGKWHMAPAYTINPAGPFDYWPLSKGFERYYGFLDGETDQYSPQLVNGNELVEAPKIPDYNLNDDLIEKAKKFIGDQVSIYPNKPFFMYYGFGTSHSPLQVPEKYMKMYEGVYEKGWDKIRQERFERQKQMGIIPANTKLAPSDPTVKPWDTLTADEKKLYVRFMQSYAGYITQADEEVGKLVSYLKDIGEYDNTMIVLISDNGAAKEGGPDGTDSFISMLFGRNVSAEELMPKYGLIGGPEMQALYPKGWAQVSNTPFREYKASVYAGGVRAPLIIQWPKGITDKGKVRSQYVHVSDITATIYDLLKIKAPETLKGVKQMPISGVSFAGTFIKADAPEVKKAQYYYYNNSRGIYYDGWKAVATHKLGTSFEEDTWQLFNVSEDYSESNDVAANYPQKLEEMKKIFMSEAEKYGVLPLRESTVKDMSYISKDSPAKNTTFKYYPEMGHVGTPAAPPLNGSYTITVPVTSPKDGSSRGVLVAMGDNMGGYTLYIKNNRLVYEYNNYGTVFKITSKTIIPTGKAVLKYVFSRTSPVTGVGSLYINDQKVGETQIKTTFVLSLEGLDVGRDGNLPVSKRYASWGDFEFTGTIDYVQFDITPFTPPPAKH